MRSSEEIESAFKLQLDSYEILICGELYVVDFKSKVQYPKKNPSRKRSIKRDQVDIDSKGVAGIR